MNVANSCTTLTFRADMTDFSPKGTATKARQAFTAVYGVSTVPVHVIRAPGRVNLIGEHTDYNDGFVFPMAIEPQVTAAYRLRADTTVRIASTGFPNESVEFSLSAPISKGAPKWGDYSRGVAHFLKQAGVPLVGVDILLTNTLPVGSGLSSSAAIEVATGRVLLHAAKTPMDAPTLAKICQQAEWHYAGVPCGIMDQMAVAGGKAGYALLLDCRSLAIDYYPIPTHDLRVVIINTLVKHELTGGEYAERKQQCVDAVAHLAKTKPGLTSLRDVTPADLEAGKPGMPVLTYRRARHVVTEIARTTAAAACLKAGDYPGFGKHMLASHASLRDDYEVSCEELDVLVEAGKGVQRGGGGVYGIRMTGGGFGGCAVALCQPDAVPALTAAVNAAYQKAYNRNPDVFATTAVEGASVIE